MISRLYNNIGICSLGIVFTAQKMDAVLPIPKALLIAPFIAHRLLLNHLSRKNVAVKNIEKLLVNKQAWFANFDARFYDGLCESVNAMQLLIDLEIVALEDGGLRIIAPIAYENRMGKRTAKIAKAADNLAALLKTPTGHLYSSLRVRL